MNRYKWYRFVDWLKALPSAGAWRARALHAEKDAKDWKATVGSMIPAAEEPCRFCGKMVPQDAKYCAYCSRPQARNCPNCGVQWDSEMVIGDRCKVCGHNANKKPVPMYAWANWLPLDILRATAWLREALAIFVMRDFNQIVGGSCRCPSCQAENHILQKYCGQCGSNLHLAACQNCGAALDIDGLHCLECGQENQ